jgi:hypothetical protein
MLNSLDILNTNTIKIKNLYFFRNKSDHRRIQPWNIEFFSLLKHILYWGLMKVAGKFSWNLTNQRIGLENRRKYLLLIMTFLYCSTRSLFVRHLNCEWLYYAWVGGITKRCRLFWLSNIQRILDSQNTSYIFLDILKIFISFYQRFIWFYHLTIP